MKKIKQLIGTIQASTLPPLKGIDAFSIHQSCEWAFNECLKFEEKLKGGNNVSNEVQREEKKDEEIKRPPISKKKGRR